MKKVLILCSVLLGLAACSSAEKQDMEAAEAGAKEKMENAKEEMKEGAKDMKEAAGATASKASCTLNEDVRVIEVKKTEAGGCELFYTKFGEAKSVASSGFGSQYCEEVKDRIQSNLQKAGFKCE